MKQIGIFTLFAIVLLTSCKTLQPIPTTDHRDSVRVETRYDSIYCHEKDSIFVDRYVKGDTVFLTQERFVLKYKDKLVQVHDTITLTQEQTIVQEVERPKTNWDKFCMWFTIIVLLIIAIRIGVKIYKTVQTGGIL